MRLSNCYSKMVQMSMQNSAIMSRHWNWLKLNVSIDLNMTQITESNNEHFLLERNNIIDMLKKYGASA